MVFNAKLCLLYISGKFKTMKSGDNNSKFETSIISAWEGIDCLHKDDNIPVAT